VENCRRLALAQVPVADAADGPNAVQSTFTEWSGACPGSAPTCTATVGIAADADRAAGSGIPVLRPVRQSGLGIC
jgi:hypothetical protein